jgi:TolB-like protein
LVASLLMSLFDLGLIFGQEPKSLTIAVVDFANTRKDPSLEYLVQGIPESVITYLGKRGEVHIVERSRLEAALDELRLSMSGIMDQQTAVELGKALGAAAVMVGSFLQISDKIRINARLIDVKTSEIIAAEQIQGRVDEIFSLMDLTAEAMWLKLVGRPIEVQPIPIAEGKPQLARKPGTPVYKRWWFWGLLGAAAGGVAYVALAGDGEKNEGTLTITVRLPD